MTDWYIASGWPAFSATGDSASARSELSSIAASFAKMPVITASGGYLLRVNAGATALESVSMATIFGGTISLTTGKSLKVDNILELAGTDNTKITFPSTSATMARTDAGQTFTGTQTVLVAATQDAVALAGRAGGTGSYVATITPTTLTASRTVTLPDASITVARSDAAQTLNGLQTFANGITSTAASNSFGATVFSGAITGGVAATFGALTATTINGNTITTGSSVFTGTAGQTYTFPTTSASLARTDAAQSLTGTQTINLPAATNSSAVVVNGSTTGGQQISLNNTGGAFFCGVDSSVGGFIVSGATTSSAYAAVVGASAGMPLQFATGNNVRGEFDGSGNFLVGCLVFPSASQAGFGCAPGGAGIALMHPHANSSFIGITNPSGTETLTQFRWGASTVGSITITSTATAFNTSSDPRLKNVTGAITPAMAQSFVMALRPKYGTWKVDGSPFSGFLTTDYSAVDQQAVVGTPNAVDANGNPVYQQMEYASAAWCANMTALVQSIINRLAAANIA